MDSRLLETWFPNCKSSAAEGTSIVEEFHEGLPTNVCSESDRNSRADLLFDLSIRG